MNPETNNIHSVIYCQHGREVLSGLRKLKKMVTNLGAWQNHHNFSIRCIHNNLTPNSIRLSSNVKRIVAEKILKKTEKKCLDIRIWQCTYTIKKLSDQKDILEKDLYEKIPSAEKNTLKISPQVHTGSRLIWPKQDRGINSQDYKRK